MRPRSLGLIPEADSTAVILRWKVPRPKAGAPGTVDYTAPSLTEVGMAKMVARAARVIAGTEVTIDELKNQLTAAQAAAKAPALAAPPAATASSVPERKVKLSSILSQVDDSEAAIMTEKEAVAAYLRCSAVYGDQERPSKESEPTLEQLSAVKHLVSVGNPPYCDLSVFGP